MEVTHTFERTGQFLVLILQQWQKTKDEKVFDDKRISTSWRDYFIPTSYSHFDGLSFPLFTLILVMMHSRVCGPRGDVQTVAEDLLRFFRSNVDQVIVDSFHTQINANCIHVVWNLFEEFFELSRKLCLIALNFQFPASSQISVKG